VRVPALCLDTSAINNVLDDPECSRLVERITERYDVYISGLNILEIAKTRSAGRRESLRAAAKQLGRDFEPLELPNHLVRQLCALHAKGAHTMRWSVADERRQFWIAMSQPESLGESERQEALVWANDLETGNTQANEELRADLERDVFQNGTPRPQTPGQLLRVYLKAGWQLKYDIPSKVYKRETGRVLPLSELDNFLSARPSIWVLYLMAYAFSVYYGSVWHHEFGPRNRAGIIDLLYAVYLPLCDVFVTHDTKHGGQYDALRVLNVFSSRRPRAHVLNWNRFRALLLAAG
jgi:hypothetical protein